MKFETKNTEKKDEKEENKNLTQKLKKKIDNDVSKKIDIKALDIHFDLKPSDQCFEHVRGGYTDF